MVSCDGPHKLCQIGASTCAGYGSVVRDTSGCTCQISERQFCCPKTPHKFSLIGKDQSHEQSNKSLQSHGGAVGLYENPEALTLFMLVGPDCSKCVKEIEVVLDTQRSNTAHHEEAHSLQD